MRNWSRASKAIRPPAQMAPCRPGPKFVEATGRAIPKPGGEACIGRPSRPALPILATVLNKRHLDDSVGPARHAPRPDFLCIGLQKGGTRWLYDSLSTHPDAWLPPVKELHYFDDAFRFNRAREDLDRRLKRIVGGKSVNLQDLEFLRRAAIPQSIDDEQYGRLFTSTTKQVTGEVTPAYSALRRDRIKHIGELFPEVKIILMIRNPIARAWSQLNMDYRKSRADQDWLADPDKVRELLGKTRIKRRSHPAATYRRWVEALGEDRMLVLFFDHLKSEPDAVCQKVWSFLDLRATEELIQGAMVEDIKKNTRRLSPTPAVAEVLEETFSDEITQCRELFGGPALDW